MAKERGMIVPFEPGQVRSREVIRHADLVSVKPVVGVDKVISYGVSSKVVRHTV